MINEINILEKIEHLLLQLSENNPLLEVKIKNTSLVFFPRIKRFAIKLNADQTSTWLCLDGPIITRYYTYDHTYDKLDLFCKKFDIEIKHMYVELERMLLICL